MNVNAIAIRVAGTEKYLVLLNIHTTYVADANPISVNIMPGSPSRCNGFSCVISFRRLASISVACCTGCFFAWFLQFHTLL